MVGRTELGMVLIREPYIYEEHVMGLSSKSILRILGPSYRIRMKYLATESSWSDRVVGMVGGWGVKGWGQNRSR